MVVGRDIWIPGNEETFVERKVIEFEYLFSELLDLLREASLVRQVNLSDV